MRRQLIISLAIVAAVQACPSAFAGGLSDVLDTVRGVLQSSGTPSGGGLEPWLRALSPRQQPAPPQNVSGSQYGQPMPGQGGNGTGYGSANYANSLPSQASQTTPSPVAPSNTGDLVQYLKADFPLRPSADEAEQFKVPALAQMAAGGMRRREFRMAM